MRKSAQRSVRIRAETRLATCKALSVISWTNNTIHFTSSGNEISVRFDSTGSRMVQASPQRRLVALKTFLRPSRHDEKLNPQNRLE